MYIVILIAALLLAAYAVVQLRQRAGREADPHYGMVEVFNGESYVWITPQEGVALNDLDKEEFITDPNGNLTYTGREYKASRGVDVSSYQGDIDWQQVYDSGVRFAVVRAGGMYYGSGELYTDDNFIKNIEGARAAGLRVGAYFFSQAITVDEAKAEAIWKSTGRFACAPRVSDGILTISPRVHNDEGVYYGMTAIDLADGNNTKRAQLVLPSSVSPFEAVYMGDTFVFSIEATYSGVGSLGNMGTYIGNEGGPFLFLSREPLACAAGRKNKFLVKVQASHFLIDTSAKTYGSLLSPDRALEYGDYPATAGKSDAFLTYATVRNSQGIPETVTARLFSL